MDQRSQHRIKAEFSSDRDSLNNWQEWRAGTNPTNAASALRLLSPADNSLGLVISWESVTNRTCFLGRTTDLAVVPAFVSLATNLPGQPGTSSFTDTNGTRWWPLFYRVRVQP